MKIPKVSVGLFLAVVAFPWVENQDKITATNGKEYRVRS
jgi:hypothetical protein